MKTVQYSHTLKHCPICEEKLASNWEDHFHVKWADVGMQNAEVRFQWLICGKRADMLMSPILGPDAAEGAKGDVSFAAVAEISIWLPFRAEYQAGAELPAPREYIH